MTLWCSHDYARFEKGCVVAVFQFGVVPLDTECSPGRFSKSISANRRQKYLPAETGDADEHRSNRGASGQDQAHWPLEHALC